MTVSGRTEERLENIQSVEPILSALRTVSQASMQTARRRLQGAARYGQDLAEMAGWLPEENQREESEGEKAPRTLLIVLGSDRGLCGTFNDEAVSALARELTDLEDGEERTAVWALGQRLRSPLFRVGIQPERRERFSLGGVPDYQRAYQAAGWIASEIQKNGLDRVLVVLNRLVRADRAWPAVEQLFPVQIENGQGNGEHWPPPILESDPRILQQRIQRQALEVNLYRLLLISANAEHATRFHLLENAAQNMERLTVELEMEVQLARQQAITTEMMDLMSGSGLIKT